MWVAQINDRRVAKTDPLERWVDRVKRKEDLHFEEENLGVGEVQVCFGLQN